MPIINDKERSADKLLWFPQCEANKVATEELLWNLRHAALSENDWFASSPARPWDDGTIFVAMDECVIGEHGVVDLCHSVRTSSIIAKSELLRVEFEALEKKWKRETRHLSLVSKKIAHPSYLRIIGMGEPAIPLLLESLRDRPSHWFAALQAVANADPCRIDATPADARIAWLEWGASNGYIDRTYV